MDWTYLFTMIELSSMFVPNTRKLSLLEATLYPTFKKLIRNEHADSFFPKGHPSPPKATTKVPSVSPNHFKASFQAFCIVR